MSSFVQIIGLPEALAKIAELVGVINVAAEVGKQRGAERIADKARETVEVRSGHTRDTVRVEDGNVLVDGAARWLEFGTSVMPAEPFLGPAVESESVGVVEDVAQTVRVAIVRV